MKKLFFIFLIFIISNNILIFFYGVFMHVKYKEYLNKTQENYLLDSCLVLAIHDFEDTGLAHTNKEKILNKKTVGYTINKIDEGKIYIKVYYKEKSKTRYREYLKNLQI